MPVSDELKKVRFWDVFKVTSGVGCGWVFGTNLPFLILICVCICVCCGWCFFAPFLSLISIISIDSQTKPEVDPVKAPTLLVTYQQAEQWVTYDNPQWTSAQKEAWNKKLRDTLTDNFVVWSGVVEDARSGGEVIIKPYGTQKNATISLKLHSAYVNEIQNIQKGQWVWFKGRILRWSYFLGLQWDLDCGQILKN